MSSTAGSSIIVIIIVVITICWCICVRPAAAWPFRQPCPTGCECGVVEPHVTQLSIDCVGGGNGMSAELLTSQIDAILSQQQQQQRSTNVTSSTSSSSDFDVDQLTSLDIVNGPLVDVPSSVCRLTSLRHLGLDRNRIVRLPDACFAGMSALASLSAAGNRIVELQDGLFDGTPRLETVDFAHNEIASIGVRLFANASGLRSLRRIGLDDNRLTSLDSWPFARRLDRGAGVDAPADEAERFRVDVVVTNNAISQFTNHAGLLIGCGASSPSPPVTLDLSGNRMRHLTDLVLGYGIRTVVDVFCALGKQSTRSGRLNFRVVFDENPLTCDCVDFEFYRQMVFNKYIRQKYALNVFCAAPESLYRRALVAVPLDQFVCDVDERCPTGCQCVYRPANSTMHVDCSGLGVETGLPAEVPPLPKTYVRYKIVATATADSNCRLVDVDDRDYFANSAIVDLSNCRVQRISAAAWTRLVTSAGSRTVLLNGNRLTTLPREVVTSTNMTSGLIVGLHDNPWSCSCEDRWIAAWLNTVSPTALANPDRILCDSPAELRGRNVLGVAEREFCGNPTVVSASSATGAVAAAVLVVGAVVYRRRVQLFVRWKFHPFDRDECVGEAMDYDVFLCCSSADHWPHAVRIVERLESSGYRVCYHMRDFVPGEMIAENICHAIVHSKRTVCLLSTDFINSNFCQHEFDVAYHHYTTVVRKKRLVVLMMLNSPSDVGEADGSASLRQYLRQYTYIDYASSAEDWFDRLLYALPVNGMLQQQDHTRDDVEHPAADDDDSENDVCLLRVNTQP